MQFSQQQTFNHAVIRLAVLLYQIDNKVTLTEQEYLEELVAELDWQSPISREAYLNEVIYQTRQALDAREGGRYLRTFKEALTYDAHKAMEVAMMITGVDGERSEDETAILSLLSHKILAKELLEKPAAPPETPVA